MLSLSPVVLDALVGPGEADGDKDVPSVLDGVSVGATEDDGEYISFSSR